MTFEQLRFIVEVERLGTILAAANSLNLSHPGISKAITNLETELGINIFLRTRSGTTVTPEGEQIVGLAREILEKADQITRLSAGGGECRALRVAAFPVDSMFFLPKTISDFRASHGGVELTIAQAKITDIIADLSEQKIDIALLALLQFQRATLSPEITHRTLFTSRIMVACSPDTPIAGRACVTPDELMRYPFVLHNDPLILKNLGTLFAPLGMPEILMKTNDNALIKQMVADGEALSIYTKALDQKEPLVAQGRLVLVPLQCEGDIQKVDFIYAHHRKKRLNPSDKAFLLHLKANSAALRGEL